MFEQTFVEGANSTRKASSVFVSFLIQCGLIVLSDPHSVDLHRKPSQDTVDRLPGSAASAAASASSAGRCSGEGC